MVFHGNTWLTYLLFSFIALVAFLGNALVLYVLVTRSALLKHPYNIFIFSLAVTDIITAIMLVFSRYLYLPPRPASGLATDVYCRTIWSPWVAFTLGYISINTCLALTIERWLAVVKPQLYQSINVSQAIKAVVFVWLWSIAINVTSLFRAKFSEVKNQCTWAPMDVGNDEFPWLDFSLQSIIPFSSMVILYGHILHTMRKLPLLNGRSETMRKVTKVALAASSAIIIGWFPSRVSYMLSKYSIGSPDTLLHYCLVVLSFVNSCVNPFLYGIYSSQFRKEYKKMFAWAFLLCRRSRRPDHAVTADETKRENSHGTMSDTPL